MYEQQTNLSRSDFSRSNRPDGFIGDDDLAPIRDPLGDGLELRRHHLDGLACFSLLEEIAQI